MAEKLYFAGCTGTTGREMQLVTQKGRRLWSYFYHGRDADGTRREAANDYLVWQGRGRVDGPSRGERGGDGEEG